MTTMLTTLEGDSDLIELEGDLYISEDGKVFYESALGEYSELGTSEDILNLSLNELSGNSDFLEVLDGDNLPILQDKEIDLYIHKNGNVYYESPLGGYSALGTLENIFNLSQNELSGNSDFIEILEGDELGKGFGFKAPKMKFKAPKMKFKAPKMKFKA
jgi:hypothetical protein